VNHGGGGGGGGPHRGGGGGFAAPRMQMHAQRAQRAPQMHAQRMQRAPWMAMPRMQRAQRFAQARGPQRAQRVQMHAQRQHAPHFQRMQTRVAGQHGHANRMQAQSRQQLRGNRANRMQAQNRQQLRANRMQAKNRQQLRGNGMNRMQAQNMQQLRGNRMNRMQAQNMRGQGAQFQNRMAARQALQANRMAQFRNQMAGREQLRGGRFNNGGGFGFNGASQMSVNDRVAAIRTLGDARFAPVNFVTQRQILDPFVATALVGVPLSTAAAFGTFEPFPASLSYLYPASSAYYYEYGDGYAYRIDRTSLLIDALFPLLAGGFLPGSYLPAAYMDSYVPAYYGFDSFYPASYDYGYGGYGYPSLCNRYAYGVVYQVDCGTGYVENVIPLYAGGYGVGQLLPSSYAYYNVPYQYRSMYYDTADYNYWYAPGAIYQYDPRSSLITSVAALLSPGFSIGQPLPAGYDVYNVPYGYRATYYDTPAAWYRYNDGYIYQVDPQTMLVSSIVASVLT
jgi:hypothetical protein